MTESKIIHINYSNNHFICKTKSGCIRRYTDLISGHRFLISSSIGTELYSNSARNVDQNVLVKIFPFKYFEDKLWGVEYQALYSNARLLTEQQSEKYKSEYPELFL